MSTQNAIELRYRSSVFGLGLQCPTLTMQLPMSSGHIANGGTGLDQQVTILAPIKTHKHLGCRGSQHDQVSEAAPPFKVRSQGTQLWKSLSKEMRMPDPLRNATQVCKSLFLIMRTTERSSIFPHGHMMMTRKFQVYRGGNEEIRSYIVTVLGDSFLYLELPGWAH